MQAGVAIFVVVATFVTAAHAHADSTSTDYQILTPVLTPGGYATSSSFSIYGVVSEFVNSFSNSSSYGINGGFPAYPFVTTPIVSAAGGQTKVDLTWTASTGYLGYAVSGYAVGESTASGGPYTFTAVGNTLSYSATALTANTPYYFVVRTLDGSGSTIATSTEVSATSTGASTPPPNPGSGGGGGGGGGTPNVVVLTNPGATVVFTGHAYPNSTVVLLKDAQIALSSEAGGDAKFSFSLTNLSPGSYVFSVYGIDSSGKHSTPIAFPETLSAGVTTTIGGIFISPTIDVDKSEVKRGDNIAIFGQSTASSTVTISVHSNPEVFVRTEADKDGAYLYNFDTSFLDFGDHVAKSKATVANEISNFGASVSFAVGTQNISKKPSSGCVSADLNCDGKTNLVDFSVMAYWFNRALSGTGFNSDLNHDGKVDLVDFSILAYHWTG